MRFDIPNYDELSIEADSLGAIPVVDEDDPNHIELDFEELDQCLPRR